MSPSHHDLKATFSKSLDTILSSHKAPSIALAIISPTTLHTIAKGHLKHDSQDPITPSSLYMLGPLTSTLIPLILTRLIAQNLFSWNSKISSLLPGIAIHPKHRDTTLEMLACHVSGITTKFPELNDGDLAREVMGINGFEGRHRLVTAVLGNPPEEEPGVEGYRNAINLLILVFVAEKLTVKSWEELLKIHLFDVVSMSSAGFGRPGARGKFEGCPFPHCSPGEVLGEGVKTPWLDCAATFPALGLHAESEDVLSYLRFCLEERLRNGKMYELAPGGKFVKAGFDVVSSDGIENVLRCKGHVSGFATGVWLADEFAFAVFVNLDGVDGAKARDEVGRVVMELLV